MIIDPNAGQLPKSIWRSAFDDRQKKEIEFCTLYANRFAHGTEGHIMRMIIAKMSELLDGMEGRVS